MDATNSLYSIRKAVPMKYLVLALSAAAASLAARVRLRPVQTDGRLRQRGRCEGRRRRGLWPPRISGSGRRHRARSAQGRRRPPNRSPSRCWSTTARPPAARPHDDSRRRPEVRHGLAGKAEIAIITYGERPTIAVDYTTDRKLDGRCDSGSSRKPGRAAISSTRSSRSAKGLQKRSRGASRHRGA